MRVDTLINVVLSFIVITFIVSLLIIMVLMYTVFDYVLDQQISDNMRLGIYSYLGLIFFLGIYVTAKRIIDINRYC